MRFLKDEDFIRGKAPMTKEEIRVFSLSALEISKGLECLDIGAGTGTISVEMARAGGKVTAIESKEEAFELLRKNSKKHGVSIDKIFGRAPQDLEKKSWDRIFIGGSGGNLQEILEYSYDNLNAGGILVMNFIVLSNAGHAFSFLKENFSAYDGDLIQVSKLNSLGMAKAENPIYILKGVK